MKFYLIFIWETCWSICPMCSGSTKNIKDDHLQLFCQASLMPVPLFTSYRFRKKGIRNVSIKQITGLFWIFPNFYEHVPKNYFYKSARPKNEIETSDVHNAPGGENHSQRSLQESQVFSQKLQKYLGISCKF